MKLPVIVLLLITATFAQAESYKDLIERDFLVVKIDEVDKVSYSDFERVVE